MKINAKCNACGHDDWKRVAHRLVCAGCRPRVSGKRPWPRIVKTIRFGRGVALIIHDKERLSAGRSATIHRTTEGYRVVLNEPTRKRKGTR